MKGVKTKSMRNRGHKTGNIIPLLPESLLERKRRSNRKRFYVLTVLLITVTLSAVFFHDDFFPETVIFRGDMRYTYTKIALFAVFYVLCFKISGVPFKMIGRTWGGTVVRVDITDDLGFMKTPGRVGIGRIYRQNTIVLTIERDDGEIVLHPALSLCSPDDYTPFVSHQPYNFGEIDMHEGDYSVGDRVYKYKEYEHPCIMKEGGKRTCIVCGHFNVKDNDYCWNCDAELVKNDSEKC